MLCHAAFMHRQGAMRKFLIFRAVLAGLVPRFYLALSHMEKISLDGVERFNENDLFGRFMALSISAPSLRESMISPAPRHLKRSFPEGNSAGGLMDKVRKTDSLSARDLEDPRQRSWPLLILFRALRPRITESDGLRVNAPSPASPARGGKLHYRTRLS
jgi:hypothetical protein